MVNAVRVFIRGPPKAVDDIVQSLFQDRNEGFCIDVGLIPQPEGDAVPDKEKLAIVVGDRSWIQYPPVRPPVDQSFLPGPLLSVSDSNRVAVQHALSDGGWLESGRHVLPPASHQSPG